MKKKEVGLILILLRFLIPELWLGRMIERGKSDYKGWTPAEMPFDTYCVHDLDGMPKRFRLELEFSFIIISHVKYRATKCS